MVVTDGTSLGRAIDVVAQARCMQILSADLVAHYPPRIINSLVFSQ